MKATWGVALVAALTVVACGGGKSDGSSGGEPGGGTGGGGSTDTYVAGPGPQGGSKLYSDFRAGKQLALYQRDTLAVTPAAFRDRFAAMETSLTAFDGLFLRLPNVSEALTRPAAVKASTIATDLEPLYALRPAKLKYNFAVVSMQSDLDAYDDWTTVYANFTALAKVARDAGLVGIVIDNEGLASLRVNYPYEVKQSAVHSLADYQAKTQEVGKRLMQSISAEFPDAVVVVLRGAAGAEAKSPSNVVNCESRDAALAAPNSLCGASTAQLLGSFFAGFVEGKPARTMLVDGGTDYGLRSAEQFASSAAWRKTALPSATVASGFIPETLRAAWAAGVNVAFGVNELDGSRGNSLPSDPMVFANTLVGALRTSDNLVWTSFSLNDLSKASAGHPYIVAAARARDVSATASGGLSPTAMGSGTGLLAQYFSQIDESELAQTIVDPIIDNVWTGVGPGHTVLAGQNDNFSVVWTGYIEAPVSGTYTIFGTTDDGMQIFIDNKTVLDVFYFQAPTEYAANVELVAGQRYPIRIRYFEGGGNTEAHLAWQPPGGAKDVIPAAYLYPYK